MSLKCPACIEGDSRVWYSRPANRDNSAIRRRRTCLDCGFVFVTVEAVLPAYVARSEQREKDAKP